MVAYQGVFFLARPIERLRTAAIIEDMAFGAVARQPHNTGKDAKQIDQL